MLNDKVCLWVVTCRWFGFDVLIVTHLFELTFEIDNIPIINDNKLRSRVMRQPDAMKNPGWIY
jgi:hypothetical protein